MKHTVLFLLVFSAALGLSVRPVSSQDEEAVNEMLTDPPATGLLVTRVMEGTQAAEAGILLGDVIVLYGGQPTPDIPSMNLAVREAEGEEEVDLVIVRKSGQFTFTVRPGRIGVHLLAVVKGKGREPLPASTEVRFDFSVLKDDPRDDWYAFYREDQKCGVGRISAKLVGETLFVLSKEILDTGSGLEDHEVTSVVTAHCGPLPLMSVFHDHMNDWTRYGLWGFNQKRESVWNVTTNGPGIEEETVVHHLSADAVPVYVMEIITGLMPRVKGACFRFRPLYEGSGETALGAALLGIGPEEIDHGGKKVMAFRYEWRRLEGGMNGIYWVGPNGRVLMADYGGGMRAVLTTESEAMKGQPEAVEARLNR